MDKTHINVGTIGHVDHGKSTLTAALTTHSAMKFGTDALDYAEVTKASASQGKRDETKTLTISTSHVEYESEARHYAHVDCPGHADFVKNMIVGAAQMDGAILLIDGSQGPQKQTVEHVLLAQQVGVKHIVVFINKCDLAEDEELLDLVEMEAGEMLESHGYKGSPVIRGSALQGTGIPELMAALDSHIPDPVRELDKPFLMPIEGVHSIQGRGTVVTGRVDRGRVKVGDKVELLGLALEEGRQIVVTGTQAFRKDIPSADAGLNVGILLRGLKNDEVQRGQVLCAPGSIKTHTKGRAELYTLTKEEGGRHKPFHDGYRPQAFFGTTDVTVTLRVPSDQQVTPGDRTTVSFELIKPIGIEVGMGFAIREGGKTIGAGRVTEVTA